ncbi:hypothetical protein NO2_0886 [Candidatus Termititenax persephonae]|uniref:Uncharacterized protein n=1 Tax=Candidatus Termititenax persephonae TaxID=2218525 RepID=A0A388TIU1_9BACT|nr:hypothetical protein NO2_0886 [Candidatus Termititenax persephonae]
MQPIIPRVVAVAGMLVSLLTKKAEKEDQPQSPPNEVIRAVKQEERLKCLDSLSAELRELTNKSDVNEIKKYIAAVNEKTSVPKQLPNGTKVDIAAGPGTQSTIRNSTFSLIDIKVNAQETINEKSLTATEVNDIIWETFHDVSSKIGSFF